MMRAEITQLSGSFLVVAPDLRGHGRSERPCVYTLRDHVQDMLALLSVLGACGRENCSSHHLQEFLRPRSLPRRSGSPNWC